MGFELFRTFSTRYPRPCIVEMGGKNPAIVLRSADLEEAAEGIMRSAFGFGGQKCSANSRVYVERPVHDDLVRLLVEKTEQLVVGDPLPRTAFLGPVIDERAVKRHQQAVAEARRDGTVFTGGEHLTDGALARGYYVEPTVVGPAGEPSPVPGRAVRAVHDGRRGRLARRGARARQRQRVRAHRGRVLARTRPRSSKFLEGIHAGVLYVNRRAGATTGAWPGVQAFGGWKGSGSTGKSGLSMYYVGQFLREQSHTIVD